MRSLYGVSFLALCCCCVVLCGAVAVSASPVETAAVSDETVALSAESTDETEAVVDSGGDTAAGTSDDAAAFALSGADTEFENLAYYDISCSLGDIRLYLPYDVDRDALQLQDGKLVNLSNSTLYLYCPEYPSYTFSASRFQSVVYRVDSSYTSVDLGEVELVESGGVSDRQLFYLLILGIWLCAVCLFVRF